MSHSTPELRPVPGIIPTIRDRWPLVATLLVVGLLGGYLAATVFPQEYRATTTVWIGPGLVSIGDVANDNSLVGPEQAAIATLDPQLSRVARTLKGGVTESDVGNRLTVDNRPDTSLLDFSYTDTGRAAAERGADVSADVYLQRAKEIAEMRLDLQAKQIQQNLTTAPLDQRVTLQAQLRTLNTTVVTPGAVLKDSAGTSVKSGIPAILFAPLGALTGLLVGLVVAYLLEGRRPRVRPGAPLPLGPVEHLGRIRREDTPRTAGPAFVIPSLAETDVDDAHIGLAVVGGEADELMEFARETLVSSGTAWAGSVVAVDLATADGLRTARSVDGVLLLVRERTSTIEDVDAALRRLQRLGVATYGVITAPATGPVELLAYADGDAEPGDQPKDAATKDGLVVDRPRDRSDETAPEGAEPSENADLQGKQDDELLGSAPRVPSQSTGSSGQPWSRITNGSAPKGKKG